MQSGQASTDDLLSLGYGVACSAAGLGRLVCAGSDILDGGFQFTQRVPDLRGVAALAAGTLVQIIAHFREAPTVAGHFLCVLAQRADKREQVAA